MPRSIRESLESQPLSGLVLDRVPVACNRCHLKRSPETDTIPNRNVRRSESDGEVRSISSYAHKREPRSRIRQALETTDVRISERGASRRIGFGVLQAITPLNRASHGLGVAGNFQPNSVTAMTASVRLVTFSALRIAVT